MKQASLLLGLIAFMMAVACTGAPAQTGTQAPVPPEGASGATEQQGFSASPRYFGEFKDLYPQEYATFIAGGVEREADGLVHSHASLRYRVETDEKLQDTGASCLSCKTSEFNQLYEGFGIEAFNMAYNEASGLIVDYFSCRTCHETGKPAEKVGATSVAYKAYAAGFLSEIDPKSAACGQCHNATCDYTRYLVGKDDRPLESFSPYRYGTDADALRKAAIEDGATTFFDEEGGLGLFSLGHPDIELFQGSVHQKAGLTCASCHMPVLQDDSGTATVSHNSSGSPFENEAAMRLCLGCHGDQGVSDTVAMRAFLRERQAGAAALEAAYEERLALLKGLIVARSASHDAAGGSIAAGQGIEALGSATAPDALDYARGAYADAYYYLQFQRASAETPGTKIAHNPTEMRSLLQKGMQRIEEGIAALS
jgi:nitrite reductase (cytochrome c-552)